MESKKCTKVRNDIKKKAFRYYLMGLNSHEIAKLTGKSYRTIQGYALAGEWKEQTQENIIYQKVTELYKKGRRVKEIALLLDVSRSTVYLWLRRAKNASEINE